MSDTHEVRFVEVYGSLAARAGAMGIGQSMRRAGNRILLVTFTTALFLLGSLTGGADDVQPSSLEFRPLLEPYGRWQEHAKWGDVWIPRRVAQHWRPYELGRWVYTDEWGWYWLSNEDFGWIVYHYGRWVWDRHLGWVWVPGDQWAHVCVPKIRFCNIGDEDRRGQAVM